MTGRVVVVSSVKPPLAQVIVKNNDIPKSGICIQGYNLGNETISYFGYQSNMSLASVHDHHFPLKSI